MEQTTLDRAALDELKRLEGEATKGPWVSNAGTNRTGYSAGGPVVDTIEQASNDGVFIRAMRNAFPALLAELEAYRNAVTWNVDCVGCAKHLDKAIQDDERIKELEAELAAIRAASDELLLLKDDLKHSNPEEYERRKEPAWDALRKARGR